MLDAWRMSSIQSRAVLVERLYGEDPRPGEVIVLGQPVQPVAKSAKAPTNA